MLLRSIFNRWARETNLESHLRMEKLEQVRPVQVQLEITSALDAIDEVLDANPRLKKRFATIKVSLPAKE